MINIDQNLDCTNKLVENVVELSENKTKKKKISFCVCDF